MCGLFDQSVNFTSDLTFENRHDCVRGKQTAVLLKKKKIYKFPVCGRTSVCAASQQNINLLLCKHSLRCAPI